MRSEPPRSGFPLGLFLACTCVVAAVICAGACIMAGIVTVLSVIGAAACLTTAAAFGMMFCALVQGLKLMLAKEY